MLSVLVKRLRRRHGRPLLRTRAAALGLPAFLAVLGPGLLAGLSDDDPAGITTYSILGARFGYELLWVVVLATGALVVFHELAARMGLVTGRGLVSLVRERYGRPTTAVVVGALLVANLGTTAAEFAGVAASLELAGVSRYASVPVAALGVSLLVLRGGLHRIEHVLLLVGAVFATYVASGFLAHPDWSSVGRGLSVPSLPGGSEALVVMAATVGTTLAPWGLAFIQSYAVDKRLHATELRYERIDVVAGAVMTGVIGGVRRHRLRRNAPSGRPDDRGCARRAVGLEPLAGGLASTLFAAGLLGAACSPPLSCRSRRRTRRARRWGTSARSTTPCGRHRSSTARTGSSSRRGGRRLGPRATADRDPLLYPDRERDPPRSAPGGHDPDRARPRADG